MRSLTRLTFLCRTFGAALFAVCLDVTPAQACECVGLPSCQTAWAADLVFIGTAQVSEIGPRKEQALFKVEEWLRGERVGEQLKFLTEGVGVSCDARFESGVRYIVFAYKVADGTWKGSCATAPLLQAPFAAEYIRKMLRSTEPGAVSGNVVFDADPSELYRSGPPLSNAAVHLRSALRELTTATNTQGDFRFERVPSGEYSLVVDVPKDAAPVQPMKVVVGAEACVMRVIFVDPRR